MLERRLTSSSGGSVQITPCSQKAAQTEPDAERKKDSRPKESIDDFVFKDNGRGILKIVFVTDAGAFPTGNTLPVADSVRLQFQSNRARVFARRTSLQTVGSVSVQYRKGHNRQYGKESPQRAQELAEEPALYCHSDQDQNQADDSGELVRGREFQRGEP